MAKLNPLEAGWDGQAIFAQAYTQTLPREVPTLLDTLQNATVDPFVSLKRATARRMGKIDHLTLTVVHHGNPYRAGTKAFRTFQLFRDHSGERVSAVKVAAYPDADYDLGYLNYASRDGYITLT